MKTDVIKRVESALGGPLDEPPTIHSVRDVAPKKIMLCVSFRVPRAVAFAGRQEGSSERGEQAGSGAVGGGAAAAGGGGASGLESSELPAAKKPKV